MLRFSIALLGVAILTAPAAAQYYPEWHRGHSAHQHAHPGDPTALVQAWYQRYLQRVPDAGGYQGWVNELNRGTDPNMVLATILGSDEYFRKGGSTLQGFIQTLYLDLAGRPPTHQELHHWAQQAYYSDRRDIAYSLLQRYPQTHAVSPSYRPGYDRRREHPDYDDRWREPPDYDYRRPFHRYRR